MRKCCLKFTFFAGQCLDWRNAAFIQTFLRKVVDPVAQWKRMREYLFSKDVPTRSVYLLELDYIESVLKKDKNILAKSKVLKAVSPDVRGVMQGFVASLLFNMMVGG